MRKYKFAEVGQTVVEEVFLKFHEIMTATHEPYFLIGGTLLGLVREGHLLHHDKDIDIGVPDEETLQRIVIKLRESGYFDEVGWPGGVRNGKIAWCSKHSSPVKDDHEVRFELQAHYQQGDTVYYNRPMGPSWPWREGRCEWPSKFFRSLGSVEAYGRMWPTPSPVEDFLTMFYGDDWHDEKNYHDWRYNTKNLMQGFLGAQKVIMVAGATKGVGYNIAKNLADQGFCVSSCGRSMIDGDSGEWMGTRCDLTNEDDIKNWVMRTHARFGYIDALIYNAGLMYFSDLAESSVRDFDAMYALSMRAYLSTLKAVLPVMGNQREGYIINIGSTRGLTAAPGKAMYSAVKHGAAAITETVNLEYGPIGVRATSANFGAIYTASTIQKYGEKIREFRAPLVGMDDVLKTINYLLSLARADRPKIITIGGML